MDRKNIGLTDLLEHSFVITIDEKRHALFKKIFKAHGLSPMPRKFKGVTIHYNSPQYNCSLAHKAAVEKAKKMDWPYVCIFEDDAYPIDGIAGYLERFLSEIPEDCAVLVLGSIYCMATMGKQGDFVKGIRNYGGHAYVVFKEYYDRYLELLKKFPEGDGPLYRTDPDLIPQGQFYATGKNLFIQYCPNKSMNNFDGYILYYDMRNWKRVKFPKEYLFMRGFPDIDVLLEKGKKEKHHPRNARRKNMDASSAPTLLPARPLMLFATVNAGTNILTNITLESIFRFHPSAKVVVVDVDPEKPFSLMDEKHSDGVDTMKGVEWKDIHLPTIDISKAKNITVNEQLEIVHRFGNKDKIEVLPCGDYQHPINIQLLIDTLDDNFILVDSDAPLNSPVDGSIMDSGMVTVAEEEKWIGFSHLDRLRPLVRPDATRIRFNPCFQFFNTKMMKERGVRYFNPESLQDNLDIAGWFKNPAYDGKESIFFWTGSLFHKDVLHKGLPFKSIKSNLHVDHLGGGTWGENKGRVDTFIQKYEFLLRN